MKISYDLILYHLLFYYSCLRIHRYLPRNRINSAIRRRPKPTAELDALFLLNSAGADNVGE